MKILQLCNKPPLPMIDGGCIAINNISSGLLESEPAKQGRLHLKILTVSTEKHPFRPECYPPDFIEKTGIEGVFVDTRVNIIDAFSALVTSDSYNISRFFSPDFDRRLMALLSEEAYDIIHLESLFMTPYIGTIRRLSKARIVLRSHNLEHLIWERLAGSTGNKAKRIYLNHLASRLKSYEQQTINEVDGIAAISFEDTNRFLELDCRVPVVTIPFGISLRKYVYTPPGEWKFNRLFHIGAMNWAPNIEAINWFLDEIWPNLSVPGVEMHLAGREMPEWIRKLSNERLVVHGEVPDAIAFMKDMDVMVVPLLSGSGMRVKIIEAMALGKVVITTTVGAEGIDYQDGVHLLLADSPEEFKTHVEALISNPLMGETIGKNARQLVETKYDNTLIVQNLLNFYHQLCVDIPYLS